MVRPVLNLATKTRELVGSFEQVCAFFVLQSIHVVCPDIHMYIVLFHCSILWYIIPGLLLYWLLGEMVCWFSGLVVYWLIGEVVWWFSGVLAYW